MKTPFVSCLAALAALASATGCDRSHTAAAPAPAARVAEGNKVVIPTDSPQLGVLGVESATLSRSPVLRLNGRLAWDDRATVRIFSPFAGRVVRVLAEPGKPVRQGDALALVTSPDFGQAQADARKASGDFTLAERTLGRVRDLLEHGAAPQKDLDAALADYSRAQTELQRATSRLSTLGGNTNGVDQVYELRSPLDGVVVERNLNPGQEIRPDQMLAGTDKLAAPLFTVTDPTRLWIQLDATESDLPHLKAGQAFAFLLRSMPDKKFVGTVDLVADFVDPNTRTVKVRGSIANPDRLLRAEMFVTAEVETGGGNETAEVPSRAVFLRGERYFVFVEEERGTFARREVTAGPESNGHLRILGGIRPGQRVVSDGVLLLEQLLQPPEGG
ncbi:MAG: efflux RND transporter periplasmic adaptor subunit [Verrucomicrobia bacterium]|nr:MAG: efflux RND transporter periplasmic adaptor subunit [Verrucomicrobiota bacterium]